MTDQERARFEVAFEESLRLPPPPLESRPLSTGAFLGGCLLICLTLLLWPELRFGLYAGLQWLTEQRQWIQGWLGS